MKITNTWNLFIDKREPVESHTSRIRRTLLNRTSYLAAFYFDTLARFGRRRLVDPNSSNLVVTLTTYGQRTVKVARTIESIGRGKQRPSRIILWIDDKQIFSSLPEQLKRLEARGLDVRSCSNYGPHTKYFPFVSSVNGNTGHFVTADDDILYPRNWLARLAETSTENPDDIVCHRAHRLEMAGVDRIKPYAEWPSVDSIERGMTVFPTGVSGVLYPPEMGRALYIRGTKFSDVAPTADDVWLHSVALASGISARQASFRPHHFWVSPYTQAGALMGTNLSGGNDMAIEKAYDNTLRRSLSTHQQTQRQSSQSSITRLESRWGE